MSKRSKIILFITLFALVRLCTHAYISSSGWNWMMPFSFLGVVLGFNGGTWPIILGDLLTSIILYVLIHSLVVYPSLKVKNNQPLTPLIALKMLGISIMYLSILVVFFFILFYTL